MIVGFSGYKGVGKGAAATALVTKGYSLIKMADPMKDMLRVIGLSEDEIEGDLKTVPCSKLGGKTPRFAMQTLGTEWGRDTIHNSIWTKAWTSRAMHEIDNGRSVVVDDVRFPNEVIAIKKVGGYVINIQGGDRRKEGADCHISEMLSADLFMDFQIVNDGNLEDLHEKVYNTIRLIERWIEEDGTREPLPYRKDTP